MASWEDEDFEPSDGAATIAVDKWDGEDEDDDELKDNWDDEEEEKEKVEVPQSQPKKKKTLDEKIREREEKKRQELLAKQEEMAKELTPEEELEEKLRRQRLQEESDLELAKEAFGIVDIPGQKTIDNFVPSSKEEFSELSNMIVQKLSKLELRTEYPFFLETLIRDCCAGCEAEEIKKISNTLNLLVQEKQKLNKVGKGKKKTAATAKKTLASGKGVNADLDYDDGGYYNEFDDFI